MQEDITEKLVVNLNDTSVHTKIYDYIIYLLGQQQDLHCRPIIMLCIGSDRYIGDALGPLVGSYLEEHSDAIVYGSLNKPVHAGNLIEVIDIINKEYRRPIIIAVDACLGKAYEVGNMEIWPGSLEAGIAVGTRLPCVGDISIIGVVNGIGRIGYLDLQCTPLSIVVKLSKYIGEALEDVLNIVKITNIV